MTKDKKKTGGRTPGTLNKKTEEFRELVSQLEEKHQVSPTETLFILMKTSDDENIRLKAASKLIDYTYPRLKQQDLNLGGLGDGDGKVVFSWKGEGEDT